MGKNHIFECETGHYDTKGSPLGGGKALGILSMVIPGFPDYRFEWHPQTKKVFAIARAKPGSDPANFVEHAEPIANAVENRESAELLVTIWASGFDVGRRSMALAKGEAPQVN